MQQLLEQLIVDFHERELPNLTRRQASLPAINGKIDTVIGMRRTGKTYFLYQTMADCLARNVAREEMLYINFDDERLMPMQTDDLRFIHEAYYRLFPEHRARRCYFFFDEIQNVPGWERYLRRLLDTENVQITVTGSSSRLLSREIATGLRGRSISTEIFPFSFAEALLHDGIEPLARRRPGAKKQSMIENRFQHYLMTGGFPEAQGMAEEYRIRILQEYVDVVILRDVVERYQISNVLPLRFLIRHLLSSTSTLFSINKFYNDMKSQGVSCSKSSLHEHLSHLMDAYLVYAVPVFSRSERVRRVNPRKMYCIDPGLAAAFCHQAKPDIGRLLENLVFIALRRRGTELAYYRTRSGYEVDFVALDKSHRPSLIQVCLTLGDPATKKREIRALSEAMAELGIKKALLLTMNEEENISISSGMVHVIPVWKWSGSEAEPQHP